LEAEEEALEAAEEALEEAEEMEEDALDALLEAVPLALAVARPIWALIQSVYPAKTLVASAYWLPALEVAAP